MGARDPVAPHQCRPILLGGLKPEKKCGLRYKNLWCKNNQLVIIRHVRVLLKDGILGSSNINRTNNLHGRVSEDLHVMG